VLVIVAPDKFKGTLTAREAAGAIAEGVREVYPAARVDAVPLADGGEGTMDALRDAIGGELLLQEVTAPDGAATRAPLCRLANGDVLVEMALASGLALVPVERRDPLRASSEGTGELLAAALRLEHRRVIVAVGGSATTDGGTGAARALGWRFVDAGGRDLPPGGGSLVDLDSIVPPRAAIEGVLGACDVTSRLVGPAGAARVFAPQKGASPADVDHLERALERLRDVVRDDLGVDVGTIVGSGAGGGMGAGLVAFCGAELRGGFDLVAEASQLEQRLAGATLVVTGEGRIDEGTVAAKVPAGVARLARAAGVPCYAVAGEIAVPNDVLAELGFTAALATGTHVQGRVAGDPYEALVATTAGLLRLHGSPE
jgi:glycerate kinase